LIDCPQIQERSVSLIFTRECEKIEIDSCCFAYCSHSSAEREGAGVLLNNLSVSCLNQSSFVNNQPDGTSTVCAASGPNLLIIGCCFSGSKDREIAEKNQIVTECQFGELSCSIESPAVSPSLYNSE
jgi:hypothetical protein